MRVFSAAKLEKTWKEKFPSFGDFFRALIAATERDPTYNLKPAVNHIHNIRKGKQVPGTLYLALFADVLHCKTDDFFVTKQEKR